MAKYKLVKNMFTGKEVSVNPIESNTIQSIPLNAPGNKDYQEYKAWLDAGNTPDSAD